MFPFNYIIIIVYYILTRFTINAVDFVSVPQPYSQRIAYDNHTTADYLVISKIEKIEADGVLKEIYTCRIGGFNSEDLNEGHRLSDCFPFPPSGAIPKHENKKFMETLCENLSKMYIVYWFKRNLVWCNKLNAEILPNGVAKLIQVPKEYGTVYGKNVIYNYRSEASYQIKSYMRGVGRSSQPWSISKKMYACTIGEFNFRNSRTENDIVDCYPYPSKNLTPKGINEKLTITNCINFVADYIVYWLDGHIVWCSKNHIESEVIPYVRGTKILNLNFQFLYPYGDKIYYDDTATTTYRVKKFTTTENDVMYACEIGGYDNKKEFSICFPKPKRTELLPHKNESYITNECKFLAQKHISYWENNRLVWCELKTPGVHSAMFKKTKLMPNLCKNVQKQQGKKNHQIPKEF